MKVKQWSTLLTYWLASSISLPLALANIPAAYLACEGAEDRAPCALPGPQYGVCIRDTLCDDPPETSVNECVICVDECWASQDGAECVRPWTGELGVCESQDRCTDKPETSFEECRRCVEGTATNNLGRETSGCDSQTDVSGKAWPIFWWLQVTICLIITHRKLSWSKAK